MFLLVLSFITSAEFPVCVAPGDQLYPDVCWDGKEFWVVWTDGSDGNIHAATVNEDGLLSETFPLYSTSKDKLRPHIAYGNDTICLAFSQELDTFSNSPYFVLLDANGTPYWDIPKSIGYHATDLSDYGFDVIRCKDHFLIYHTHVEWNEWEGFAWGESGIVTGDSLNQILTIPGLSTYIYDAAWNGERILFSTSRGFIWRFDSLGQNPFPEYGDFFMPRVGVSEDERYASPIAAWKEKFGMIGSYIPNIDNDYFDLLDKEGSPENETPLEILPHKGPNFRSSPNVIVYGKDRFIYVSSQATGYYPNWNYALLGTEIDTNMNLIDEGYLMGGPREERYPNICFGSNHFLLVWCDNRSGDWDIYGRILDSLEYSGIAEPATHLFESQISADRTVFTHRLKINLSPSTATGGTILIHDAAGREVRRLKINGEICVWNGENSRGETVSPGVYFISLAGKEKSTPLKVIKIR